jgi:hypothetical protein
MDGRFIGGHKAEEQIQVAEATKDLWRLVCEMPSPTCWVQVDADQTETGSDSDSGTMRK